ncbi:MAG: pilus assembly protein PilM [Thermoleophilaceae bacterium]|nr:pilus assembly protein PilM [Thermoleophilaceae bacterium]
MAISLRKTDPGSTGLDIDGSYLSAVGARDGQVRSAASVDLPEGVVVDGELRDPLQLAEALKQLFAGTRLSRKVRLGVANQQIVMRQIELPPIEDEEDRAAAVRFQAAEAVPMPLDETVLDYQVVGEAISPEGVARSRIMLVAARKSMIEMFVAAVSSAGLRPVGVDLDAFALVRTLALPDPDPTDAVLYCHLGGSTNLAIALGSICLFTRPLTSVVRAEADEDADPVQELAEEIRLSMDYYLAQPDARPVARVMLSGPGSAREGFAAELAEATALEVVVAEPLGLLGVSGMAPGEDPHRHTVAAGLALGAPA